MATSKRAQAKGFISFKTVPDLEYAENIASLLRQRGVTVTFIHGDVGCPFAQGTPEADKWIRGFLDGHSFNVLISIASRESMRSKWVLHEFWRGLSSSDIIVLLWFSGSNPGPHFIPVTTALSKWLPTRATTYLIDCRNNANDAVDIAEQAICQFPAIRRNRSLRRFWTIVGCLGLFILPMYFILTSGDPSDPVAKAQFVDHIKMLGNAWLVIIFAVAAVIYPSAYRLPGRTTNLTRNQCLTAGFSLARWGAVVWCLTLILTGTAWGAIPSGIFGAINALITALIGESLLKKLVARSYRKADTEQRSGN
jgi:hypothetical protein